jgi:glycosyltransferase involved in cell wall biosynthesis
MVLPHGAHYVSRNGHIKRKSRWEEFIISECEKQEFSEKIINLWDDFQLQEQLIENGINYVISNYSWGKSVEILEELFRMAIAEKQFHLVGV